MSASQPCLRRIAILGATGSIGTAAVDVVAHLNRTDPEVDWRVYGISGHHNVDRLASIAAQTEPCRVVLSRSAGTDGGGAAVPAFPAAARVDVGPEALCDLAADPEVDILVAAIVGRAGLESTLAAIAAGKRVAIANKETLVVAGGLVRALAERSAAELLPVDSEHSAISNVSLAADSPVGLF